MQYRTFIGLDVHARSVKAGLLDGESGEVAVRSAPARTEALVEWIRELAAPLAVAYEAGPTGYGLARALEEAGVACLVAAPSREPPIKRAGPFFMRGRGRRLAGSTEGGMSQFAKPTLEMLVENCPLKRSNSIKGGIVHKTIAIVSVAIVVSLAAAACGSSTSPATTPATTPVTTPVTTPATTATPVDNNTQTGTFKNMAGTFSLVNSQLVTKYAGKIRVVLDDGTTVSATCPKAKAVALKHGEKVTVTKTASGGWVFVGTGAQ